MILGLGYPFSLLGLCLKTCPPPSGSVGTALRAPSPCLVPRHCGPALSCPPPQVLRPTAVAPDIPYPFCLECPPLFSGRPSDLQYPPQTTSSSRKPPSFWQGFRDLEQNWSGTG